MHTYSIVDDILTSIQDVVVGNFKMCPMAIGVSDPDPAVYLSADPDPDPYPDLSIT
jgi:hypothetical protein